MDDDAHSDTLSPFFQSIPLSNNASISTKDESTSFVASELNCERNENLSIPKSPVQTQLISTSPNIKFSPNYRRRPGKRYSIVKKKPGRVKEVRSTYFATGVESPEKTDTLLPKDSKEKSKWIPPRSPYALIQEDLFDNPWQLLIATIFLTKTRAELAIPQIHKFLTKWPSPNKLLKADFEEILEILKPLGLGTLRSRSIVRFTKDFLEKDWSYPIELHGIGKYGNDSYRMFCVNEWREVTPTDIPLSMYKEWLTINEDKLGLK